MDELLYYLSKRSHELYRLNLRQISGDYDYFVTWLKSVDPNNHNEHYGVIPAGENTIAPLANNCPIPYTVTDDLISGCTDKESALNILNDISNILSDMESLVREDEVSPLSMYEAYTDDIIELIE